MKKPYRNGLAGQRYNTVIDDRSRCCEDHADGQELKQCMSESHIHARIELQKKSSRHLLSYLNWHGQLHLTTSFQLTSSEKIHKTAALLRSCLTTCWYTVRELNPSAVTPCPATAAARSDVSQSSTVCSLWSDACNSQKQHLMTNINIHSNNRFTALCPGLPGEPVPEETFTHPLS